MQPATRPGQEHPPPCHDPHARPEHTGRRRAQSWWWLRNPANGRWRGRRPWRRRAPPRTGPGRCGCCRGRRPALPSGCHSGCCCCNEAGRRTPSLTWSCLPLLMQALLEAANTAINHGTTRLSGFVIPPIQLHCFDHKGDNCSKAGRVVGPLQGVEWRGHLGWRVTPRKTEEPREKAWLWRRTIMISSSSVTLSMQPSRSV